MEAVAKFLKSLDYECATFPNVCPTALGWPVRRSRVYVCALLRRPFGDFWGVYNHLQGEPQSLCSVEDLCPPISWAKRKNGNANPLLHEEDLDRQTLLALASRPIDAKRGSAFDLDVLTDHANYLTRRELMVLSLALESHPQAQYIDVSQSAGRAPLGQDVLPCVTPGARIYSIAHKTFLTGRQKLLAQGIFPSQPADPFQDGLESDLAGNAFNSIVFAGVFASAMASASLLA